MGRFAMGPPWLRSRRPRTRRTSPAAASGDSGAGIASDATAEHDCQRTAFPPRQAVLTSAESHSAQQPVKVGNDVAGVLDGIRVLDFGRYIAGPYCAAMLAEHGAE